MKKMFMLFGGLEYYAQGGLSDYVGVYETLEEAQLTAESHLNAPEFSDDWWEWAQIGKLEYGLMHHWEYESDDGTWKARETL